MNWAELPTKLRVYVSVIAVIGLVVAVWAAWDLSIKPPAHNGWLVLLLLVLSTVPFSLFLPSVSSVVGIGDAYAMAIAMIYGVSPCIIATFGQTFIISLFGQRKRRHIYRIVFNTSSTICAAWLYGNIYHLLIKDNSKFPDIIVPAAVLAFTYFFVNTTLTSFAIAWSERESVMKFWANSCMPLAVDYSLSALCATALVILSSLYQYTDLAAAPVIFALWGWNKYHQARHMQTQKHLEEQEQLYMRTVESLALAVDAKDQTTYGHIRRVKVYAIGLARLCGIKDENELKAIATGSLLHDIGKIAIDDYILNKPGRLSKREYEKIKVHSTAGDEILQQVRFPYPVAKYVRYHHERWDGQGYPDKLKEEEIPLAARILSIADSFDAIRFSRPYKPPIAQDEAARILRSQSGTAYDPNLVEIFIQHIEELEQAALRESENAPQLSFRNYSEGTEESPAVTDAQKSGVPRSIPTELIQLGEYCTTLFAYLPFNDMLPVVSQRLKKLVPFSTCVYYLSDGDDRLTSAHAEGTFSDFLKGRTMEIGKGISGWVAAYRHPMINTEPALDFQGTNVDFTSFKDAIVVPIMLKEECLGTISLYALEPITYSQEDLSIVETVASFLAPLLSEVNKNRTMESHGVLDSTTGLHRISYLSAVGPKLISNAIENDLTVSLIYIEIRNLAQITRIFGSSLAESTLKRIADCIKLELRESDILVRYGQQGYVAFLPGVRDNQALRCGQRLRQRIKNEAATLGQGFNIDYQTGMSLCPRDGSSILSLLQTAQENMRLGLPQKAVPEGNVVGFYRT